MKVINLTKSIKLIAFLISVAVVILAILFSILSIIILFSNFSPTLINKVTTILSGIGIFITSYIAARIINKKGIIVGLICGGTLSFIVFLTTFITTGVFFSITEFIKIITITLAGVIGGILGANSKEN